MEAAPVFLAVEAAPALRKARGTPGEIKSVYESHKEINLNNVGAATREIYMSRAVL
jgi:hypothetical protein